MSTDEQDGGRVTMRTLNDKLALVRSEQRTAHVITRAIVVGLAVPNALKQAPYLVSSFHWIWPF